MKIFLVISLFTISTLFAQDCKYQEYNSLVSTANKYYSKNDFKKASEAFKKAFSKTDFPLGKDLSLALIVAQKTKDMLWVEDISIQLVKGGVPIRYFARFVKSKWFAKFKVDYKKHVSFYHENFDQELKEKWISLILKDRHFNLNRYHAVREGRIDISIEELIKEATEISKEFIEIYNTFGYPGEQEMGYLYNTGNNKVVDYPSGVLLRHIYQRGEEVLEDAEVKQIVCDGKLRSSDIISPESIGGLYGVGLEESFQWFYEKYKKN